ncbi:unnamed protein product, partial [Nesidiocoris tenuis]
PTISCSVQSIQALTPTLVLLLLRAANDLQRTASRSGRMIRLAKKRRSEADERLSPLNCAHIKFQEAGDFQ